MRIPFYRIIEIHRACITYNQTKNYEYYMDHVFGQDEDKDSDPNFPNKNKEPFKWSTWEIQTAMEYDMFVVPTLGNDGWSKAMTRDGIMAHTRL